MKKLINDDRFTALDNEFFSVRVEVVQLADDVFYAHSEIIRKDTGEVFKNGVTTKSNQKKIALDSLFEETEKVFSSLAVPVDWNNSSPVKEIIRKQVKYKKSINHIWSSIESGLQLETMSIQEINNLIVKLMNLTADHTKEMCFRLPHVDIDQLQDLVEAKSDYYCFKNAEKLDAMTDIFFYLEDPDASLVLAHQRHLKNIESMTW